MLVENYPAVQGHLDLSYLFGYNFIAKLFKFIENFIHIFFKLLELLMKLVTVHLSSSVLR